jgi:dipeptidyl aminopeptidase/acylaminoacyl peptidase
MKVRASTFILAMLSGLLLASCKNANLSIAGLQCSILNANLFSDGSCHTPGTLSLVSSKDGTAANAAIGVVGYAAGNGDKSTVAISADGSYATFLASSTNLTPYISSSASPYMALYKKSLKNISTSPDFINTNTGNVSDITSETVLEASLSSDGRYVSFVSNSASLVSGIGSGNGSGCGYALFMKDTSNLYSSVSVISTMNGTASTSANANIQDHDLSPDGRYVVFATVASNLVPTGDYASSAGDAEVYLKDLQSPSAQPVLVSSNDGTFSGRMTSFCVSGFCASPVSISGSHVSADGQFIVFGAQASNLTSVPPSISGSANSMQIYKKDLSHPSIPPVLVNTSDGTAAGFQFLNAKTDFTISSDARYVVYTYNNEIFLKDTLSLSQAPVLVSTPDGSTTADGSSASARISADGRYVVFLSTASNLIPGVSTSEEQVYIKDLTNLSSRPILVSSVDGTAASAANGSCNLPAINSDGSTVVFVSAASNLVPGFSGATSYAEVYVWKRN